MPFGKSKLSPFTEVMSLPPSPFFVHIFVPNAFSHLTLFYINQPTFLFGWSFVEDVKLRDYFINALYLQLFPNLCSLTYLDMDLRMPAGRNPS